MRYYEVYLPDKDKPAILTNVRRLRDLPEGTRIYAIITELDGTLAESDEVPVVNGKAQIAKRSNRRVKCAQGRF